MPRQPNRDRSKLPPWAQQEMERLEANVRYYQGKVEMGLRAEEEHAVGTFTMESKLIDGNEVGLPTDKITAHFGDGEIDIRFEPDRTGKKPFLYLMCGGDYMMIYPGSSNTLKVKPVHWTELP